MADRRWSSAGSRSESPSPTPPSSIERDYGYVAHHPLAEAYIRYIPPPHNRPTWDLTSVLYAVLGDRGYFDVSPPRPGHRRVRRIDAVRGDRGRPASLPDPPARAEAARARGPGPALQSASAGDGGIRAMTTRSALRNLVAISIACLLGSSGCGIERTRARRFPGCRPFGFHQVVPAADRADHEVAGQRVLQDDGRGCEAAPGRAFVRVRVDRQRDQGRARPQPPGGARGRNDRPARRRDRDRPGRLQGARLGVQAGAGGRDRGGQHR